MNQKDLVQNLKNIIKKLETLKNKEQDSSENFEEIKDLYFSKVKRYIKKYKDELMINKDTRIARMENWLKYDKISDVRDGYIIESISAIKQFKSELKGMSNEEYKLYIGNNSMANKNYRKIFHPIWWFIWLRQKIKKHRIISIILTLLLGVFWLFFNQTFEPIVNKIVQPLQVYLSGLVG